MTLEEHIQDIKNRLGRNEYLSEQAISQGIVLRLLGAVGWDMYDTKAVIPEYQVEGKRVDFALCVPKYNRPVIFIEVKRLGNIKDADRQLFDYASREGTPFIVATDGREWHFYLPAQPGDYDERKIYKLDLTERDAGESSGRLQRYLSYDAVASGKALEDAQRDYKDESERRQAKKNIPEAWKRLIEEKDEILLDVIREKVEDICGVMPTQEQVVSYLKSLWAPYTHTPDSQKQYIAKSSTSKPEQTKKQLKRWNTSRRITKSSTYKLEGDMDTWTGGGKDPRKIKVTFPDGTVIHEGTGAGTFVKTVRRIGAEKIQPLGIPYPPSKKIPLISKQILGRESNWRDVGLGFYVNVDLNKYAMFELLKEINDGLGLGLRVEFRLP